MLKVYALYYACEVGLSYKYMVCESRQIPSFGEIRKWLEIEEFNNAKMLSFDEALSVLRCGNYLVYPPA